MPSGEKVPEWVAKLLEPLGDIKGDLSEHDALDFLAAVLKESGLDKYSASGLRNQAKVDELLRWARAQGGE